MSYVRAYTGTANTSWKTARASDKALGYVETLFGMLQAMPEKAETYNIARTWWADQNAAGHPTGGQADQMIQALKRHVYGTDTPVQSPQPAAPARLDFSTIPDGNYAIREDGVVRFYRVKSNRSGWKVVQRRASDNLLDTTPRQGVAILHQIVAAGLEASQHLFADELGRCWCCGKSLTDEVSRSFRMGPDCRAARGIK